MSVHAVAPFNRKAAQWVAGRKEPWAGTIHGPGHPSQWIWFHVSSMGELEDGLTLLEDMRAAHTGHRFLLTFSSPTGYEYAKDKGLADHTMYLPVDTWGVAQRFIAQHGLALAVFVRHDIWPGYLKALKQQNVPVVLTSFLANGGSKFFRWPQRALYHRAFNAFDIVMTQDERTAELLATHFGMGQAVCVGNMRVDRVLRRRATPIEHADIAGFIGERRCLLAGSTLPSDEPALLKAIHDTQQEGHCWIIVPHEIRPAAIHAAIERSKVRMCTLSCGIDASAHVLWVDEVGRLADLYRYADAAYVGGGFERSGIHNILEPVVWGCHVAFGPVDRAYPDALELLASGGAVQVQNADELSTFVRESLTDHDALERKRSASLSWVIGKSGATFVGMEMIDVLIARP